MSYFAEKTPTLRRNALVLILLAVLLASTGVAWWLSHRSVAPPADELWYLMSDANDQPVGWSVVRDKGVQGYEIRMFDKQGILVWSQWALNAEGTQGKYIAVAPAMLQKHPVLRLTRIELADGKITVRQGIQTPQGRQLTGFQVVAAVGTDYVAEGTLWTRVREAAKSGTPFVGTMVLDELAQSRPLAPITLTPREPATQRVGEQDVTLAVVDETFGDEEQPIAGQTRFYVAEDGTIPIIEGVVDNQVVDRQTLAGFDAVRRHFPDALGERTRVVKQHKLD